MIQLPVDLLWIFNVPRQGEKCFTYMPKKPDPKLHSTTNYRPFRNRRQTGSLSRLVNTANTPAKAVKFCSPKNSDKNPCHTRYVCESSPVSVTSPGKGDHGHHCSFSLLQKIIKSKHVKTKHIKK